MAWNPLTDPCDFVKVNGQKSPGIAVVEQAGSPREWEERRPFAFSGATAWYRGQKLSHFIIKLYLYTVEDWEDWQKWRPLVAKPPLRTRAKALKVSHPLLADLNIGEMVIEDQKQPIETDPNVWMVEINCLEFRMPKYALAKPDAAQAKEEDPVDRLINNLTNQVNTLANPPPPLPKRVNGPPPLPEPSIPAGVPAIPGLA